MAHEDMRRSQRAHRRLRAPLPDAPALTEGLRLLLRREVVVQAAFSEPSRPRVVAEYIGAGRVVVGVADLRLSAALAASLALLPVDLVDAAVQAQRLEPPLDDHAHRAFLSLATLLDFPAYAPVELAAIAQPGDFLSHEGRLAFTATRDRLDLVVGIDGYGGGRLQFRTAWGAI
jgi:hypothetical protein